jgi:hypothetical protein
MRPTKRMWEEGLKRIPGSMWIPLKTICIFVFVVAVVSVTVWLVTPFPEEGPPCPGIAPARRRAVGFYHLWMPDNIGERERLGVLLNTQIGVIAQSATLAETREVYVKIICPEETLRRFAEELVQRRLNFPWLTLHIEHITAPVETEAPTIDAISAYCKRKNASGDYVWYVHDKGAFHGTPENTRIMPVATGLALGPGCWDQVANADRDVCGMRWVRYPHAHFAASNMWLARCSYISRLPNISEATRRRCTSNGLLWPNGTFAGEMFPWVCGCDRYAPEHWIGLGSGFMRAADCLGYVQAAGGVVRTYFRHYLNLDFEEYGMNCTAAPKPELETAFEAAKIPDFSDYYGSENYFSYLRANKLNLLVDGAHFLGDE